MEQASKHLASSGVSSKNRGSRKPAIWRTAVEPLESRTLMSTVYTATGGYSVTSNPSGPWAFGYTTSETSKFVVFDSLVYNGGLPNWLAKGTANPIVAKNTTGSTFNYSGSIPLPAGALIAAPGYTGSGRGGYFAVTQFTAPAAGSYVISTSAEGWQTAGDSASVHILVGGKSLYDANVTGSGVAVTKTLTIANVAKGATIDFSVGASNSGAYDDTVYSETITANPATITATAPAAQTATAGTSKSFALGSFTETGATGPYTATVNWGDGTASSTIKLTAAGTIPATAHTFAAKATDTVSVTVTDSAGHTSNKATFSVAVAAVVANASISGKVFNDSNGDKKQDDGEFGLGLWTVYIDLKNTGSFVTGDPVVTTNVQGAWSFTGLAAGTYTVRVDPVSGAVATTPTVLTIKLATSQLSTGNLFGEKAIA